MLHKTNRMYVALLHTNRNLVLTCGLMNGRYGSGTALYRKLTAPWTSRPISSFCFHNIPYSLTVRRPYDNSVRRERRERLSKPACAAKGALIRAVEMVRLISRVQLNRWVAS